MSKLSVAAYKAIRKKRFRSLPQTTLYTKSGPAIGTMWLNTQYQGRRETVTALVVCDGAVRYSNGDWDTLEGFHEAVATGMYTLVGVQQPVMSYVPRVFS